MILPDTLNAGKVMQISYSHRASHEVMILLSSRALVLKISIILDVKYPNVLASVIDLHLSVLQVQGTDLILVFVRDAWQR